VNEEGAYVDCITAKDLRVVVEKEAHLKSLYHPSKVFFANKHLGKQKVPFRTTCKSNSTLEDVILTLSSQRYHRVFVLDDSNVPIGVITLGDVLKLISKNVKVEVTSPQMKSKKKNNKKKQKKSITGEEEVDYHILSMNDVENDSNKKDGGCLLS